MCKCTHCTGPCPRECWVTACPTAQLSLGLTASCTLDLMRAENWEVAGPLSPNWKLFFDSPWDEPCCCVGSLSAGFHVFASLATTQHGCTWKPGMEGLAIPEAPYPSLIQKRILLHLTPSKMQRRGQIKAGSKGPGMCRGPMGPSTWCPYHLSLLHSLQPASGRLIQLGYFIRLALGSLPIAPAGDKGDASMFDTPTPQGRGNVLPRTMAFQCPRNHLRKKAVQGLFPGPVSGSSQPLKKSFENNKTTSFPTPVVPRFGSILSLWGLLVPLVLGPWAGRCPAPKSL